MPFKSEYSDDDNDELFYARVEMMRETFGYWEPDADPVSHCILDLCEAQREIFDLFETPPTASEEAAFKAAVKKRHAAGDRLMEALSDRDRWPDPELGLGTGK